MRFSLLAAGAFLALCGLPNLARAQAPAAPPSPPPQACPNVAGHWASGGLVMVLGQKGCEIGSGQFEDGGYRYIITGRWNDYGFNWIMTRVAKADGCTSWLLGMAVPQSPDVLHSVIMRTAGKCDLDPNYGEARDWSRQVLGYH